nr:hypothetical protein [Synechococcus sp. AH-551-E11]
MKNKELITEIERNIVEHFFETLQFELVAEMKANNVDMNDKDAVQELEDYFLWKIDWGEAFKMN